MEIGRCLDSLSPSRLAAIATKRTESMLRSDIADHADLIRSKLAGKRVLVVGGAGSIGSATVRELVRFEPEAVHVVDQNENNLTELVRALRSRPCGLAVPDFRTLPLDFGSSFMQRFIESQPPYDHVLNFAALKHVRSEKDTYSLWQMISTNVLKAARLLHWLAQRQEACAYFCVSTDKAANPVNLMGASKRLMEHMIFSGVVPGARHFKITSARFANVAYSDGSLLHGWIQRLQNRQPIVAPRQTRRFFLSLEEAGQLCLLAATVAQRDQLVIPRLKPETDLHALEEIARATLIQLGLQPSIYESEEAARKGVEPDLVQSRYPLLLTPLDTMGEKSFEEFVGVAETAVEFGMEHLLAVEYRRTSLDTFKRVYDELQSIDSGEKPLPSKKETVALLKEVIPELEHATSDKTLDQRM